MNEEETTGVLLPGTPDTISSKEEGRSSSGKGATTPSRSPKEDRKVVPRYLGASVGSCHDFCKYGRNHSFRSKEKHRGFRLSAGSRIAPEKEQIRAKIPSLAERRRRSSTKQKASAHLKTGLNDEHVILEGDSLSTLQAIEPDESKNIDEDTVFLEKHELSEGPEAVQCTLSSAFEKIETFSGSESIKSDASLEGTIAYDDPRMNFRELSPSLEKTEVLGNSESIQTANGKNPLKKIDSSPGSASNEKRTKSSKNPFASIKSKFMQKVPSPVKKAISSAKSKVSKQEAHSLPKRSADSPVKKAISSAKSEVSKQEAHSLPKRSDDSPVKRAISSAKSKVSKQEAHSLTKRSDASARPALSGKSKGTNLKSASPLSSTEGRTSGNYESKRVKSADLPIQREKKILKPLSTSLSSQPTLNRVLSITLRKVKITRSSSVKRQKKVGKTESVSEKIKEKTLYVIAPKSAVVKTQQSRTSSSSGLNREQKHRDSDSASVLKHVRAKTKKPVQSAEKTTPRKRVDNHPEDKDPTAQKLKFSRGKVVEPQFVNETPKRIVFRQGRKMGNSQSGKFGRRSFKNKDSAHGDTHHPCPEAQIVVLKHQDAPDKKETQGLYNDVIEETANKLAETRKSKVKAFVGAFETVISLQESRPSPQV